MGGGEREGAARAEGVEHHDAKRAAFFRIGGAAQLVDQHQRIAASPLPASIADRQDVRGERAEAFLQRLMVADVGQHLVEQRKLGFRAGTGNPAWVINASSPTVLSATVLPPVLGPLISNVCAV